MTKNLGAVLCFSSVLCAASPAQAYWQFEGDWLLGVSGGFANKNGNIDMYYGHPAPGSEVSTVITSLDGDTFLIGFLAGYQVNCCRWLFGAEVNIDWRNPDGLTNFAFVDVLDVGWNAYDDYDQQTVVGFTGRIGYHVSPCFMTYMRLGLETSKDEASYIAVNSDLTNGVSLDDSRQQYRVVFGLGAEIPISLDKSRQPLSIRFEYNYYSHGKGVRASGFADDEVTFVDANFKGDMHGGRISVVYNFF